MHTRSHVPLDARRNAEGRTDGSRAHLALPDRTARLGEPVFVFGVPRSFTWLVCAMLGQHPQMYGLPELQLFCAETMSEWFSRCPAETFPMEHGLVRAVAETFFGAQTVEAIASARGWLRRRAASTTGLILEELIDRMHPRILVEKSPGIVYDVAFMARAYRMFPLGRFLHLVRHPIDHGQAVVDAITYLSQYETLESSHWLLQLASAGFPAAPESRGTGEWALDPQVAWYELNVNIRTFLQTVPAEQTLLVRGEDLLTTPDETLHRIAAWLGLRTDAQALAAMKQPHQSVFARRGPATAEYGTDLFLATNPYALAERPITRGLDATLPWSDEGTALRADVRQLARDFGYE
jgi:Sulfotransferase family